MVINRLLLTLDRGKYIHPSALMAWRVGWPVQRSSTQMLWTRMVHTSVHHLYSIKTISRLLPTGLTCPGIRNLQLFNSVFNTLSLHFSRFAPEYFAPVQWAKQQTDELTGEWLCGVVIHFWSITWWHVDSNGQEWDVSMIWRNTSEVQWSFLGT